MHTLTSIRHLFFHMLLTALAARSAAAALHTLDDNASPVSVVFDTDGGSSGRGIVVNFGMYDGAYGVTNATWSGTVRGQNLSIPVGEWRTYAWPDLRLGIVVGGAVSVQLSGVGGQAYVLETSDDLVGWADWQTVSPTNLPAIFEDTGASARRQRFYRFRKPSL
jgi:hypothetical protein